jgi:ABC-type transporter Mla subunit MlaD
MVQTAERRGWFVNKVPYYCYVADATGMKAGDAVRLLGRDVGRITEIDTASSDPWFVTNNYNVFVKFEIRSPYHGYILTDSRVRLVAADFFGSRFLEVTRGDQEIGSVTVVPNANVPFEDQQALNDKAPGYPDPLNRVRIRELNEGIWLFTEQAPTVTQQAGHIVSTLANALPTLTNQIAEVLARASETASNANLAITRVQPTLVNVENLTARLLAEEGAIGRMLLTTNLQERVETALGSVDATLTNTTALLRTSEQQLQEITRRIALALDNVTMITSNLSAQVNANSMVLGEVSSLVVTADDLLQGLKRHWLLRSAFPASTNPAVESVVLPSLDPGVR